MATRFTQLIAVWLLVMGCGGCASLPPGHVADPKDPFERYNRAAFSFNDAFDRAVLKPVATAYRFVVPNLIQEGIGNFFDNVSDLPTALNALLQGEPGSAATHLGRFAINSTVGLLGTFDVATSAGLERDRQDFGLTLGKWGMGSGPYVVIPFFGPSSVRDSFGLAADFGLDPLLHLRDKDWRYGLTGLRVVEKRASVLQIEKTLDSIELDAYLFTRDAYLSRRRNSVYDGDPPPDDLLPRTPASKAALPSMRDEDPKGVAP
jgi:phospholipid-binding lipoprotein MlaA